ncbi:MAG TPA: DUF4012 domain-containing protein [Patescibacteria group bacterium]|nr:DUF4012 domain-containing protein [Patescibacteria group bacterium]
MFHRKSHNFLRAKAAVTRPAHPAVKALTVTAIVLMLVVGVTALIVAPFWYISENVYTRLDSGKTELQLAQDAAAKLDFAAAIDHVDAAQEDFTQGRAEVQKLEPFSGLPFIGPHVVAADRLLVSAGNASSAIHDVLGVAGDVVAIARETEGLSGALSGSLPDASRLFKDLSPEQKHKVLAAFADGVPDMQDALVKVDAAIASFDEIPQQDIARQFVEPLKPFREKLVSLREWLTVTLPIAETVPSVLGYPEAKHYLFFFQNNTELRPTGGFLGVYGLATVKDADLASLVTDDVYALDGPAESTARPSPPEPIRKYIGIDKWYLRDANWSPDFVVSAEVMARFFAEEAAVAYKTDVPPVDGVLAVDPEVAKDVLKLTGPITIDGKTFTSDNVVDELEFAVEKGFTQAGVPFQERKGIVGRLVTEVIARLKAMPVSGLLQALGIVHRDLEEGHILISMRDTGLQTMVLQNDWGGKLKTVRGDYLSVIDANLASLKSDPAVQRSVAYAIAPQKDGSYVGSVKITYDHHGHFDWKTTRYRTYTRVYVPLGSKFLGVYGAMENDKLKDPGRHPGTAGMGDELGRTWFGAFISVEPGEKKTLEFRFSLAPSAVQAIRDGKYHLDVEKQPGTIAHGLTLDLDFGKKLTTAEPPEDRKEWGDTRYRFTTDLRIDRAFDIGL